MKSTRIILMIAVAGTMSLLALSCATQKAAVSSGPSPSASPSASPEAIPSPAPSPSPSDSPAPVDNSVSVSPAPSVAPYASQILAIGFGFAPDGSDSVNKMHFRVAISRQAPPTGWAVDIFDADGNHVRKVSGDGNDIPTDVVWDGKSDDGSDAPQGSYRASLSVSYGTTYLPYDTRTDPFVLIKNPPVAKISIPSTPFAPSTVASENSPHIAIGISADDENDPITAWSLSVVDSANRTVKSFSGTGSTGQVDWDGRRDDGSVVDSGASYTLVASATDSLGNTTQSKGTLDIDILTVKTNRGDKVDIPQILFKAFDGDYSHSSPKDLAQNIADIKFLATALAKYQGHKIKILGYAVHVLPAGSANFDREQSDELLPLSLARANSIRDALIASGISADRISTDGLGSDDHIVPDSNIAERWQNRRVDVYLDD